MLDNLKKYFNYNQKERSGSVILMIIIFMLIMVNMSLPYFYQTKQIDYSLFEKEIEKFEMKTKINYTDQRKMDSDLHLDVDSDKNNSLNKKLSNDNGIKKLFVDINTADSTELLKLFGIGPVFASRILKYRKLLGGYSDTEQLLEVFGMDSVRFQKIIPHIMISDNNLRKINLNNASFKDILRHPYISYEAVKEIVNYRKSNGGFSDVNELMNVPGIDTNACRRLLPYLTI